MKRTIEASERLVGGKTPASEEAATPKVWSGGNRRKEATGRRAARRHLAAELAAAKASRALRDMLDFSQMSKVQLAAAMEMGTIGYLSDIEQMRMRRTPQGELKHIKTSLELLVEMALECDCDLNVVVSPRRGIGKIKVQSEAEAAE